MSFISGSTAVATVAMPVVALFIVLSGDFAVTLWMKREPRVCLMQRAERNCCAPAADPFHAGLNMTQRILLSLLSLFKHAILKSSFFYTFTGQVAVDFFLIQTCFRVKPSYTLVL